MGGEQPTRGAVPRAYFSTSHCGNHLVLAAASDWPPRGALSGWPKAIGAAVLLAFVFVCAYLQAFPCVSVLLPRRPSPYTEPCCWEGDKFATTTSSCCVFGGVIGVAGTLILMFAEVSPEGSKSTEGASNLAGG